MTYWRMDGCLVHNKRYINDTSSCATSRRIFQPKSKEQGAILFILELFELFYNESMLNLWMCVNLQMRAAVVLQHECLPNKVTTVILKHSCGEWNHLQLIWLLETMYFWYVWRIYCCSLQGATHHCSVVLTLWIQLSHRIIYHWIDCIELADHFQHAQWMSPYHGKHIGVVFCITLSCLGLRLCCYGTVAPSYPVPWQHQHCTNQHTF